MINSQRCIPERLGHKVHRVAVKAVAARLLDQGRQRHRVRIVAVMLPDLLAARSRVPRIVRPEHAHAGRLQLFCHVGDGIETARHRPEKVKLIAVVDANICIRRPH